MAVIAVVTRFRTQKTGQPESTQCVPKKNMNCHGVSLTQLMRTSGKLQSTIQKNPVADFIFF